jgi:hypothetical protein
MRARLTAAVAIMQAISLGLSIPVLNSVLGAKMELFPRSYLWACFAFLILASGVTRKSWGIYFGSAIEIVVLLVSLRFTELLILNVIFAGLWAWAVWIGTKIDRDRAQFEG